MTGGIRITMNGQAVTARELEAALKRRREEQRREEWLHRPRVARPFSRLACVERVEVSQRATQAMVEAWEAAMEMGEMPRLARVRYR